MYSRLKTVGIYPNSDKDPKHDNVREVIYALKRCDVDILMKEILRAELGDISGISFVSDEVLSKKPDAMIVLGGDGTILEAARHCAPFGVPLLGINLGRVGYMAEIEMSELDMLEDLISGDFHIDERMTLRVEYGSESFALNDAVLGGKSLFRMVEIELFCDSKPVNRYRADGLIISTPTGSTAYSLSAGGAVVDPRMDAVIATPICSHSLNATPIVFSADSVLELRNVTRGDEKLTLCVDGCEVCELASGESVKIGCSPMRVKFIRLKDGGFYEILRHKMAEI